jgi:histidyl-tRNA synthetase
MEKVRPALLRGFDQEYLPHEQLQFNHLVDVIRRNFELFGFLPIETPSAERTEILTSKGGVEKEIYALKRLWAAPEEDEAAKGALRFDLTVPLARYVAMHERELAFPFRRYQIQRVWRGETPQARKGRFREFYQCDIDIINRERLSYLAEAEIPSVIHSVFKEMAIGEFRIRINNRKVLKGLLHGFEVPEERSSAVLRALDKAEKETRSTVVADLRQEGLSDKAAHGLYDLIATRRSTQETLAALAAIEEPSGALRAGLEELGNVAGAMRQFGVPDSAFGIDLGVVRGLDYYTGTIYETELTGHPELGSICSGGRYDDLASYFTDTKLPGVGISIGLSRLFAKLKEANLLAPLARTPAEAIVLTLDSRYLGRYIEIGTRLRNAGINTEVYLEQAKMRNQLAYADRKNFRAAVIAGENEFQLNQVQVKNLASQTSTVHPLGDVVEAVRRVLRDTSPMELANGA